MRELEASLQQFADFLLKALLVRPNAAPFMVRAVRQFLARHSADAVAEVTLVPSSARRASARRPRRPGARSAVEAAQRNEPFDPQDVRFPGRRWQQPRLADGYDRAQAKSDFRHAEREADGRPGRAAHTQRVCRVPRTGPGLRTTNTRSAVGQHTMPWTLPEIEATIRTARSEAR